MSVPLPSGGPNGPAASGTLPGPINGAAANSLEALLSKRAQLDDDLRATERALAEQEEQYLEETNHYGNVVRGWDGFLTSRPRPPSAAHGSSHSKRTGGVAAKERVFSLSSTTAPVEGMGSGLGFGLGLGDDGLGGGDPDLDGLGFGGHAAPLSFRGDGLTSNKRNRSSKMGDADGDSD